MTTLSTTGGVPGGRPTSITLSGRPAPTAPGRAPINLLFAQGNAFYRRGDLFAKRRKMMQEWADYIDKLKTGAEIMDLFGLLAQKGHTLIVVTHEEDVARHAQRILRIRDGQIAGDEQREVQV